MYVKVTFKTSITQETDLETKRLVSENKLDRNDINTPLGENSNAPDLRLPIWVVRFENTHFINSYILVLKTSFCIQWRLKYTK